MLLALLVLLSVLATPLAKALPEPKAEPAPAPAPIPKPQPKPEPNPLAKAPKGGVCEDIDEGCPGWKESGFCETHKDLMSYYCPASCGTCTAGAFAAEVDPTPVPSYYQPQTAAYNPYPAPASYEEQTPYNYNSETSYTSTDDIKEETGYVIAKIIQDVKTKVENSLNDLYVAAGTGSGDLVPAAAPVEVPVATADIGSAECYGKVENGKLVGMKPGDYGHVECNEGFQLDGDYYVFCNYEGKVEGTLGTCNKACNDWNIEGGKLTPIDRDSGWLFYECENGGTLTGDAWIWCENGKVEALPTCSGGVAPVAEPTVPYVDPYAPKDPYVDPYAPEDPYVDPYAPKDPYVDPYAPKDPYVDPYAPKDPYVDPYAPQDPYVDPYVPKDPYVDPYAPQDPYVDPYAPKDPYVDPYVPEPYATAAPVEPYVDPYATAAPKDPVKEVASTVSDVVSVVKETGKCDLPVVKSGSWSDPYGDGNYWFLKCNDGSVLEGSDYLYCDESGAVYGDAGKCLADKCKAAVENGKVSTEKVGDYYVYAQISCNEGFEITGTMGSYCVPTTGEFTDPLGTCSKVTMKKK